MTIAELCLLAAVVLTSVDRCRRSWMGGGNMTMPIRAIRSFYTRGCARGRKGRISNGYEAFPFFAAAVILAEMRAVPQGVVNGLAVAFIAARIVYVLLYLTDRPTLRSLIWSIGFAYAIWRFSFRRSGRPGVERRRSGRRAFYLRRPAARPPPGCGCSGRVR